MLEMLEGRVKLDLLVHKDRRDLKVLEGRLETQEQRVIKEILEELETLGHRDLRVNEVKSE
jgi:hypothetical protein